MRRPCVSQSARALCQSRHSFDRQTEFGANFCAFGVAAPKHTGDEEEACPRRLRRGPHSILNQIPQRTNTPEEKPGNKFYFVVCSAATNPWRYSVVLEMYKVAQSLSECSRIRTLSAGFSCPLE
jgi:hypothetical protein